MGIIKKKSMPMSDKKSPSIATAYEMQRRNKGKMMMAHGGSADEGPSEKANQKGVNKIAPNYDREHSEVKHGQSEARYGDKRAKHMETLEELRAMPKPKLAQGGMIKMQGPKMADSSIIKPRMRDEVPLIMEEPSEEEMQNDHMEMMAEGGEVEEMQEEMPMDEEDMEHHDSIASAIMSKRAKYAQGGMVDIESNAQEEESNAADEYSEAALKENYDEDFSDMSQPMDSNEHSDDIPSDKFDRIRQIRAKNKRMR